MGLPTLIVIKEDASTSSLSTTPGFNQIQFEGFCRFIDQGLTEIEFQLFVETYQLVEPLIKERDDVYESLTYSSELYVSAGLIWKTSRDMQEQTLFIGNIPLMNSSLFSRRETFEL